MPESNAQTDCEFCTLRAALRQLMDVIDDVGETGVELFDDPLTDIYNAADNARDTLMCYCEEAKR